MRLVRRPVQDCASVRWRARSEEATSPMVHCVSRDFGRGRVDAFGDRTASRPRFGSSSRTSEGTEHSAGQMKEPSLRCHPGAHKPSTVTRRRITHWLSLRPCGLLSGTARIPRRDRMWHCALKDAPSKEDRVAPRRARIRDRDLWMGLQMLFERSQSASTTALYSGQIPIGSRMPALDSSALVCRHRARPHYQAVVAP